MTKQEFLAGLDDAVSLPAGTLQGPEQLEDLENWDSMAMVSFIALADSHNGKQLSVKQIGQCKTVAELLQLAQVEE